MRNFKFYTICLILSFLTITSPALANIDGYFYDVTLSSNGVKHDIIVNDIDGSGILNNNGNNVTGNVPLYSNDTKNTSNGISFKVGKKFTNFLFIRNLFIAPSISYDYINSNAKDKNGFKYSVKDRYIADMAFGFDFNKKFSTYISLGLGDIGYEVDAKGNSSYVTSRSSNSTVTSADLGSYTNRKTSLIYGIGTKYRISRDTYITTEYSQQEVDVISKHSALLGGVTTVEDNVKIKTIRIGISRNL